MWGGRHLLDAQMRYRGHIWTHGQGSGQRGVGRGAPGVARVWDVFKTLRQVRSPGEVPVTTSPSWTD